MHPRTYTLLEKLQRIDDALRRAQRSRGADPAEIEHLRTLKLKAKTLINRLQHRRVAHA